MVREEGERGGAERFFDAKGKGGEIEKRNMSATSLFA